MVEPNINDESHLLIFEEYVRGIGITPRMITAIETGTHYRSGEEAARILGVTRQNINNCVNGRQRTVRGLHLVKSGRFRMMLARQLADICKRNGTDVYDVMDKFRELG